MGNKTELQGHNIDLNRIIDLIGSLPTAQNWSGGVIIPGTSDITVPAYTNQDVVVQGDADLTSANIRSGINLFGVTGTYGEGMTMGTVTVSNTRSITITHGLGKQPSFFLIYYTGDPSVATESVCFAGVANKFLEDSITYERCVSSKYGDSYMSDSHSYSQITMNAVTAEVYAHSNGYYWRAGTYKWFAFE